MKKSRKRKTKHSRRAPTRRPKSQKTRRAAQTRSLIARAPAPAPVASSWLDLGDDRSAFALLAAPFIVIAFAVAANVFIQSSSRFDRFAPEHLQARNNAPEKIVIHSRVPTSRLLKHNRKTTGHDTLTPISVADVHSKMRDHRPGENVSAKKPVAAPGPVVQSVTHADSLDQTATANILAVRTNPPGLAATNPVGHKKPLSAIPPNAKLEAVRLAADDIAGRTIQPAQVTPRFAPQPMPGNVTLPPRDTKLLSSVQTSPMAKTRFIATAMALTVLINGALHDIAPEYGICTTSKKLALAATSSAPTQDQIAKPDAGLFGVALARAASEQTKTFVIYNDRYIPIRFPMGDVPSLYGVCTDVVIRAYRALGIDLQDLVYRSRIGNGDRSINHRRTRILRSFFKRFGKALPITKYPEDFLPGDIVTYYRPQNRGSKQHIAIVADVLAPSGRPMIIHNRGWGPQMEDALFVDKITGHYRYTGPRQTTPRTVAASQRPLTRPQAR